ncbi:VirB8/TrbF family protein [uncultured Ruegeria sp.]|uniref:virB8 family protein n=1 Tax=uncultured Ruegeria sp. TaxID=259304 RepID=UPI00262247EB|nr:VirB8/TrbF family protein [uncultured Ruegeria sp.]
MQHAAADLKPDPLNPDGQYQGSPLPDTNTIHAGHDRWEDEMYLSMRRRIKVAYIVAGVGALIGVMGVAAVMGLAPLKQVVPITMTVDKHTGLVNVESRLGNLTLDDDEYVTQALLFQYARDRETYDAHDQRDRLNLVYGQTCGGAAEDLAALYLEENPNSPMNIYGNYGRVDVRIRSVTLHNGNSATLRITKSARAQQGAPVSERNFVVTMVYEFDRTGNMKLEERWENPTGFCVNNYRLDEEAR